MSEADRLRILYVDDDKDIRHIVKLSLALDPLIELRLCADGAEALEVAATGAWRSDLVMLDVMMPRMDGPTLMVALRELAGFADIPFVFVTARAREADVQSYHAAGARGVILKPFNPLTLAGSVRTLVG
ncbi:response regulator [Sphingomonas bisphenolicum]|uniref:Response regulator n=1 Tax=Sphingomonas bisphenolicum TaxID=296544 RepID=A0ABN5W7Z2_9SPHN|nr:response regulator [Sphingomonas bisphenolicum]BBF68040.1 response regulator [Sphingomonas bisphenolicum]